MGQRETPLRIRLEAKQTSWLWRFIEAALCLAALAVITVSSDSPLLHIIASPVSSLWNYGFTTSGDVCPSPPPNLFAYHPPRPTNDLVVKASKNLDKYLSKRVSKPDIDSIAISVVTVNGPVFESGYGTLRANESNSDVTHLVDRDSIYRIASITKMFTVLETLILRERGSLNWWDPRFLLDICKSVDRF